MSDLNKENKTGVCQVGVTEGGDTFVRGSSGDWIAVADIIKENQALAAHVELITHKADNLNSMCAMAVGALPNKSPVAESLVYWIKNWNDFKQSQSPQTSLAEVRARQAEESFVAGLLCGNPSAEGRVTVIDAAKEHAAKIREEVNNERP